MGRRRLRQHLKAKRQHKQDEAWVLGEIAIPGGATTEMACKELIGRYPEPRQHVAIYGDPSGSARKTSASQTDYQIIREILGTYYHTLTVHVPASHPAVADRVNAYNGMLKSASGTVRYHVDPSAKGLIEDLARVSWRQGTREIDKRDKRRTHFTDADGYRMAYLFPVHAETYVHVSVGGMTPDPVAGAVF